ncbi:MAG: ChaN family lipoprotein [Nitrospirota bacterium]|nr:MAG: ChaN family lipoprotein [Nitrospirota bacterium]
MFDSIRPRGPQSLWLTLVSVFLLLTELSCAWGQDHTNYKIGQLFEVKTKQIIPLDELTPKLMEADVIYLGEEHYTPSHIEAALKILRMLLEKGRKPVLALEMFGWDGQSALDLYRKGQIQSEEQFLKEAAWEKNWGGDFKDYKPLVEFSKDHHIPLYALNPPKDLVRLVRSKGLTEALRDPSMRQWNIPEHISLEDPEYRRVIFPQITACHPGYPDKVYQPFYEASIFRDEGMAKVIKEYLQKQSGDVGPLVSYTGGGHIQYRLPVPNRVQKTQPPGFKDISIYLIALDPTRTEDIDQAIDEGIADYVWLTELGPRGPQPRCG